MENRCDSVDALMYAYYEFMKMKEANKMLEKDKNCIEFSMRSMMATHKPYQDDTEIAITGMAPGKSLLLANNPFDIPCDVVVVSKRYFERLQTENEQLKKKLAVPDPFAEYKELFEKLHSKEDIEKFEWTLNHICGGQASANGWMVTAKLWRRNYETLSKLVGFSSVEEIQDYLTNKAECDTLQEAILKLIKENKYACEKWANANSSNNSWKAAAECNSPKELIEKRDALEHEVKILNGALQEWKEGTGCPSPSSAKNLIETYERDLIRKNQEIDKWQEATKCETPEAAATWITSYESACGRGNRLAESVEKLKEEVVSWKNVTGYSTPEDYTHARINCATPFDYTAAWQDATGCVTPDQVKSRIEGLENAVRLTSRNMIKEIGSNIDEWQKFTGCDSPQKAGCKIDNLCDEICELKGDYDHLLELTGYKNEKGIYAALVSSDENHLYITMRDLINSLKRKAKFTESNWQKATGCETPKVAYVAMDGFKELIKKKDKEIEELRADYSHLLLTTGFESEGEIEDALDKCDHSSLRKALVDYEFDYEALLKLTGYKSERDIRDALRGEKFPYQTMRDLINSLRRKAKWNL